MILDSGSADSAKLSWKFVYDKTTDTKPISATYSVDYSEEIKRTPNV